MRPTSAKITICSSLPLFKNGYPEYCTIIVYHNHCHNHNRITATVIYNKISVLCVCEVMVLADNAVTVRSDVFIKWRSGTIRMIINSTQLHRMLTSKIKETQCERW